MTDTPVQSSDPTQPERGPPAVTSEPERIRQAVDTLFGYNAPVVRDAFARLDLPIRSHDTLPKLQQTLTDALADSAAKHRVALPALVAVLDDLQEHGRQHVFLFQLSADRRDVLLAPLRDEATVRQRTEVFTHSHIDGCEDVDCFNRDRFIWDADAPELAELRHTPEHLVLRWVETRWWLHTAPAVFGAQGQKAQTATPESERSVNFFQLDLYTGAAALLLQALKRNPGRPLLDELEIYRELLHRILGLDTLLPVPLEPVIRMLMNERPAQIRRWAVNLAERGWLDGHDAPSPDAEELRSGRYAGRHLLYDWQSPLAPERVIAVRMIAQTDQLDINTPSQPDDHQALLAEVRQLAEEEARILDVDLKAVAERMPDLRPVMLRLDLQFSRFGQTQILASQLSDDEGISLETAFAAFEALRAQNSQRFHPGYYVEDPQRGRPIPKPDGSTDYDRRDEIPPVLPLKRARTVVNIPTEANIGARLFANELSRDWVISLHGIRTHGGWQKPLGEHLNEVGVCYCPFDYGYVNLLRFLLPWTRQKEVERFRDRYTDFCRIHHVSRCSIIAHSFGTYLAATAMECFGLSFDRVILCGSIIRRDFPWALYLKQKRVRAVLNDCGRDDLWVKLVVWFVRGTGASGAHGFFDEDRRLLHRVHAHWRHSDFFYAHNYRKRWVPFIQGRKPQEIEPTARPTK